jgi:hypothetical protein
LAFEKTLDAYATLQVDPAAHEVVIRAAYHALARRYHPDGDRPDARRMAELQVHDAGRKEPMGPGATQWVAKPASAGGASADGASRLSPYAGPLTRAREAGMTDDSARLDFGRYTGWSLRDLARHDPDYLRWLSRHSSGVRFRGEILQLLPDEAAMAGRR